MHADEDGDGDKHEYGDENGDEHYEATPGKHSLHADEATPGKHYAPQSKRWMLMCGLWQGLADVRKNRGHRISRTCGHNRNRVSGSEMLGPGDGIKIA